MTTRRAAAAIVRERLARQFLLATPHATGRDVVKALGAVQSQDYQGAAWALAQRTADATAESIEAEFTSGAILRTHVLRPTWHFVDPADIRWMLALTAPRVKAAMASYNRVLELDARVFRRSHAAVEKALAGRFLTRAELRAVLEKARIGTLTPQRMGHLMMEAELDALICSGPRRGKDFTYALLDERVPVAAPIDRDEALLRLTMLYFRGRSPATLHDFNWWSGQSMADVRRGVDIAGTALSRRTTGGREVVVAADGLKAPRGASAHLLPNYDEFFIGHKDRSAIGERLRSVRAVTGGNALIAHVVVVDGQLVGGWRLQRTKGAPIARFNLLDELTVAEQRRVSSQARRLECFLGEDLATPGLG